ncbi:response regulator [Neobacillus sp. NPDC058068]|uniref:response regulator transcription factor n=1 Tax=Neobacillus sp. NPDC058068 TaxID=3346325 RepID=UPI0036D7DADB
MYKVAIVDDDRIIRKGLSSVIPWEEHGFQLVGDAADGEKGLELIEKEQPQIVVSDIKMPFMDGLEMARISRDKMPLIKFIFLTGYEDFQYAHEAIKIRAFDYLLKPVDSESLLQKIKEAAAAWEQEDQKEKRWNESSPFNQKKFLEKFAVTHFTNEELKKELSLFGIRLDGSTFLEGNLTKLIELGLASKVNDYLEEIKNQLVENSSVSLQEVQLLAIRMVGLIGAEAAKWLKESSKSPTSSQNHSEILEMKTISEIFEMVKKIAIEHAIYANKLNENKKISLVDKAIAFIESNYQLAEISLQKVAEEIHVNPAYLSNLFKVEKGFNFGDFLVETRMKAAMELIRQSDLKNYEVASKTGYSNPQYFSICFKKYTGYSPAQFKKLI